MPKKQLLLLFVLCLTLAFSACRGEDAPPVIPDTTPSETEPPETEPTLTEEEIAAIVEENLAILAADIEIAWYESEFVDAHPESFEAIVSLGEAALPHLKPHVIEGSVSTFPDEEEKLSIVAKWAVYTIAPEQYDLVFPSPDGKREVKLPVSTFNATVYMGGCTTTAYKDACIVDSDSGKVIVTDVSGYYEDPTVLWSPDGRYAVVTSRIHRICSESVILDADGGCVIELPSVEEIESAAAAVEEEIRADMSYYPWYISPASWRDDGKVEMHFFFKDGYYIAEGTFAFDPVSGEMTDVSPTVQWISEG